METLKLSILKAKQAYNYNKNFKLSTFSQEIENNLQEYKFFNDTVSKLKTGEIEKPQLLKFVAKYHQPLKAAFFKNLILKKYNRPRKFILQTNETIIKLCSEMSTNGFLTPVKHFEELNFIVYANFDTKFNKEIYTKTDICNMVEEGKIDVVNKVKRTDISEAQANRKNIRNKLIAQHEDPTQINTSEFLDETWMNMVNKMSDSEIVRYLDKHPYLSQELEENIQNPNFMRDLSKVNEMFQNRILELKEKYQESLDYVTKSIAEKETSLKNLKSEKDKLIELYSVLNEKS